MVLVSVSISFAELTVAFKPIPSSTPRGQGGTIFSVQSKFCWQRINPLYLSKDASTRTTQVLMSQPFCQKQTEPLLFPKSSGDAGWVHRLCLLSYSEERGRVRAPAFSRWPPFHRLLLLLLLLSEGGCCGASDYPHLPHPCRSVTNQQNESLIDLRCCPGVHKTFLVVVTLYQ